MGSELELHLGLPPVHVDAITSAVCSLAFTCGPHWGQPAINEAEMFARAGRWGASSERGPCVYCVPRPHHHHQECTYCTRLITEVE